MTSGHGNPRESDQPDTLVEAIRQMRMAALYPHREELEGWILTAKELLERLPEGPKWQMAVGYIDGMIAMYNRRFGDERPLRQRPTVPFADQPMTLDALTEGVPAAQPRESEPPGAGR